MSISITTDLLQWLVGTALPFWAERGVDKHHGGFFEKLTRDGSPVEEMRRSRLTARQIYCFAEGARLGWQGPSTEIVCHGLEFLTKHLIREDGSVVMAVSYDGKVIDNRYDPYDYAFVLFALASAARALDDRGRIGTLALRVRNKLFSTWAHPEFGFEEAAPRKLPLKSNPQMHLFEAFLAWAELFPGEDTAWRRDADKMASLALRRLISTETHSICEWYDGEWQPFSDTIGLQIEPGHQFEWAWLLARWSIVHKDDAAFTAATRLADVGELHGIDPVRKIAINAVDEHFAIRDADAKLWPQTERAKAWHILSQHPMNEHTAQIKAAELRNAALSRCQSYILDEGQSPLWREVMRPDGSFIDEPVRASSLYHIVCAISTVSQPAVNAEKKA